MLGLIHLSEVIKKNLGRSEVFLPPRDRTFSARYVMIINEFGKIGEKAAVLHLWLCMKLQVCGIIKIMESTNV